MTKTRKNNKKQPEADQPQPQPAKTQPISKPKKYTQKSVEAIERIERSKHQRIFLLSAVRNQSSWTFLVLGTTGSQYTVTTSTTVHCTCFDFRMKKKPCKHIFFIVTQVAQNEEILDYFRSTSAKISAAAYKVLDQQLTERLKSRMAASSNSKKDAKEIDLKDDTDCTICFTEMDKENEDLQDCGTCKKYFHVMCIDAWKKHNPTCPLCRSEFKNKGPDSDPLGQLKNIKV